MTTDGRPAVKDRAIAMCEGKDPLTPEQARKVAKRMRKRDRLVEPYRCRFCNQWHVGAPKNMKALRPRE